LGAPLGCGVPWGPGPLEYPRDSGVSGGLLGVPWGSLGLQGSLVALGAPLGIQKNQEQPKCYKGSSTSKGSRGSPWVSPGESFGWGPPRGPSDSQGLELEVPWASWAFLRGHLFEVPWGFLVVLGSPLGVPPGARRAQGFPKALLGPVRGGGCGRGRFRITPQVCKCRVIVFVNVKIKVHIKSIRSN
jgi:hypothetical protein